MTQMLEFLEFKKYQLTRLKIELQLSGYNPSKMMHYLAQSRMYNELKQDYRP
jgi:hypothetical protein